MISQEYHHERSSTHDVCRQAEAGAEATAAALRRLTAQHAAQQAERLQRQEGLQQRLEEAQAAGMGWDFWRDGAGMVGIWVSLSLYGMNMDGMNKGWIWYFVQGIFWMLSKDEMNLRENGDWMVI